MKCRGNVLFQKFFEKLDFRLRHSCSRSNSGTGLAGLTSELCDEFVSHYTRSYHSFLIRSVLILVAGLLLSGPRETLGAQPGGSAATVVIRLDFITGGKHAPWFQARARRQS